METRTFPNITINYDITDAQKKIKTVAHLCNTIAILMFCPIVLTLTHVQSKQFIYWIGVELFILIAVDMIADWYIEKHQLNREIADFIEELPKIKQMQLEPYSMIRIVYHNGNEQIRSLKTLFQTLNVQDTIIYNILEQDDVTALQLNCHKNNTIVSIHHQARPQKHKQLYDFIQTLKPKYLDVLILAVDFDHTLAHGLYPKAENPDRLLIQTLIELQKQGHKLILWTCRVNRPLIDAVKLCETEGLIFDAINENLPEVLQKFHGDSRKISADLYIDDNCYNTSGNYVVQHMFDVVND